MCMDSECVHVCLHAHTFVCLHACAYTPVPVDRNKHQERAEEGNKEKGGLRERGQEHESERERAGLQNGTAVERFRV